jgi:small GTP-binding protein
MTDGQPSYKFIIAGDSGVGKTSIISRLVDGTFSDSMQTTLGVEFKKYEIETTTEKATLQIWDTAGQERFRAVSKSYFRNAVGAALVFALDVKKSFEMLDEWLTAIQNSAKSNAAIIIVGNKLDLQDQRQITEAEGKAYADKYSLDYIETSAKDATDIREIFVRLVDRIALRRKRGEIQGEFTTMAHKLPRVEATPDTGCSC